MLDSAVVVFGAVNLDDHDTRLDGSGDGDAAGTVPPSGILDS